MCNQCIPYFTYEEDLYKLAKSATVYLVPAISDDECFELLIQIFFFLSGQIIIKMAAANGVRRVWVGKNTLMSTPAVSAVIRERSGADVRFLSLNVIFVVIFECMSVNCVERLTPVSGYRDRKQLEHLS